MSVSLWQDQYRRKGKIIEADVTIIGAGIAGLSSAYWINKLAPDLKVIILEKYEVASGASGRNAGFITCGSVEHYNRLVELHGPEQARDIWRFSEANLELLKEEIIQGRDSEFSFQEKGSFSLAVKEHEFDELKKSAKLMESQGIAVETLDEKEINSRLGAQGFIGGIKYLNDASVDPVSLLNGIRKRLKNTQICEGHEVYSIEQNGESKMVFTSKAHIECSLVVMATNAYSSQLDTYFKNKIYPTRGQILATAPVAPFMEGPCYANFVLDYFRQLPTGELVIGGFRQLKKDAEVGFSDETSDEIQAALEAFIVRHLPKFKDVKVTHRWSGVMGFSADGQALVGSLPTDSQTYFLGGFTAHGLGLAFHCAKVLAEMICQEESLAIPHFINAKRF